eukprot:scaffold226605_cov20-Tisochrysis_lutea.AAC.1
MVWQWQENADMLNQGRALTRRALASRRDWGCSKAKSRGMLTGAQRALGDACKEALSGVRKMLTRATYAKTR